MSELLEYLWSVRQVDYPQTVVEFIEQLLHPTPNPAVRTRLAARQANKDTGRSFKQQDVRS